MNERLYDYTKITDLKDMLKKSGEEYGNKIAYQIKTENKTYINITHKEVREMIDALGTALLSMGLKDKRIAVIGENRFEWEIAYLAIVCGVGTVVPLDKSLPENELRHLIERSDVEAIFYTKRYETILENVKHDGLGKLKHLISMDLEEHTDGKYSEKELIDTGKKIVELGDRRFIDAEIDKEKMSIMLFTSGTTSASKIVALSHNNICSNLMDIASVLDVNSNDVFLSFLPLHHVFECTVGFLFALYKGAKTVFCDGIRHITENMKEYEVSIMASVPAIYEGIFKIIRKQLEKQGKVEEILQKEEQYKDASMEEKRKVFKEIHEMLGGNIKLLISGAASLDAGIEEKYRLLGLNLVQGYGLTETSPVVAVGTNKYNKIGSIGKAVPSVKVKIVNPNKDCIGELAVQGPSIMLEYFENPEETKKALVDNWFYTGDLAKIDEEGYIFICGRKKSVIVLKNGKNIFPEEMENLINRIEGIEESFVFGKQMSEDKEDIKIFAKLVYNKKVVEDAYKVKGEEEIYQAINNQIKAINKTMPHYKAIKGIILTQEPLIKTTTNKIKRQNNLEKIQKEEKIWNYKI
jgi:long-chain acyl-CoA synthetase